MIVFTQRRILLLMGLGVSLLVWIADAIVGGGPKTAQATVTSDLQPTVSESTTPLDQAARWLALLRDDPRGRAPLGLNQFSRDPFDVSEAMLRTLRAPAQFAAPVVDELDEPPRQQQFEDRHNLRGVVAGRNPRAVVDGYILAIGAELDGYQVVEIQRDAVIFERDGDRRTLSIPPPR